MPAVFFGHGNPMNAIENNRYTEAWKSIGARIGTPRGIVSISAHWYPPATLVTSAAQPRTIHDFGGFPQPLYEVQYPAPGSEDVVTSIQSLLAPVDVLPDENWGLDHGTWSVLVHVFPEANIPTVQLSIDETKPARFHYELGRRLATLRDEGILVMGSGNIVHNLHAYAWGRVAAEPFDWAARFETLVRDSVTTGNHEPLIEYESLGRDSMLSVPTPEHYLPLLYVLGTQQPDDAATFPVEGIDGGSVSMLSVMLG